MRIDCTGEMQVTVPRLAQITVTDDWMIIDLASASLMITQTEGRLTIGLHPELAFTAPEARGEVAEAKGIPPFEYVREA